MTLEDFNESCEQQSSKIIEDYTNRTASIPEWCPKADPLEEYKNYTEERLWIPAIDDEDDEWTPLFVLLARSALTHAQESIGVSNREAMENSCSGYADQHISNVFHRSEYIPVVALWRLLNSAVPARLIERWSSVDIALFEKGLQKYGKNFVSIKSDCLRHKTTMDLVEFYYGWKRIKIFKGIGVSRSRKFLRKSRGRSWSCINGVMSEGMLTRSRRLMRDQTVQSTDNIQITQSAKRNCGDWKSEES